MDLKIKDKVAFITGSSSGIGYATAKVLLNEGVKVYINGKDKKKLSESTKKLKESLPKSEVYGVHGDFLQENQVDELISKLPEIDILINNVGIYKSQSFFKTKFDDWMDPFQVNFMSGVRLSKHILPSMLSKNWGRIIFISSECAYLVPEDMIPYSVTKAAMHALSKGLANLTKGSGVTVNTIVPGSTLSEGAEDFLTSLSKKDNIPVEEVKKRFFENVRTSSLINRFANMNEVATTIAYLSSPLSSATNGSVIKVEGGSTSGLI